MCNGSYHDDFDEGDGLFCVQLGDFYHSYKGKIPWDTFAVLRVIVAWFNIGVFVVVVPPYLFVIWIMLSKADFRGKLPYRIMINISLIEQFFMLENLLAGYLVLRPNDYYYVFSEISNISSAIQFGSYQASPFLSFILSVNRFMAVLSIRNGKWITVIFSVLIGFAYVLFIPVPICLHYFSNNDVFYAYNLLGGGYGMGGDDETFMTLMGLVGPCLLSAAFLVYIAIVAAIIIKKELFGSNYKISPMEIRIIVQAFLIAVPSAILILAAILAANHIEDYVWVYLCFNMFAAVIPANTLVSYIIFNSKLSRILRAQLKELLRGKKVTMVRKPTTVQQTTTVQTRLNNASSSANTNALFVRRSSERK